MALDASCVVDTHARYLSRSEPINGVADLARSVWLLVGWFGWQAKIIHIARDPMDTCFSCYRHHFEPGTITFSNSLRDLAAYYSVYRETVEEYAKVR